MAEENNAAGGANAQKPQGQGAAAPIVINAQYIRDLSFENPNAPQTLLPGREPPQVAVNVDVQGRQIGDAVYEAVLNIKAEATAKDGQKVFIVELSYGGVFTLEGVPEEHRRAVLLVEGPRLLFPFARAIVAEATRDGGYPPLLVNPIDFADLLRRQVAAQQGQQANA